MTSPQDPPPPRSTPRADECCHGHVSSGVEWLDRNYWSPRDAGVDTWGAVCAGSGMGVAAALFTSIVVAGLLWAAEYLLVERDALQAFAGFMVSVLAGLAVGTVAFVWVNLVANASTPLVLLAARFGSVRIRRTKLACFCGGVNGLAATLVLIGFLGVGRLAFPGAWRLLAPLGVGTLAAQIGGGWLALVEGGALGPTRRRSRGSTGTRFSLRQVLAATTMAAVVLGMLRLSGALDNGLAILLVGWLGVQAATWPVAVAFVDWRWRVRLRKLMGGRSAALRSWRST